MSRTFKLDPRLSLCAEFVRKGSNVADIGTDHGYLPAWLCINNKINKAIASDINKKPLDKCKKTIEKYNLESKIKTRLSNGLERIDEKEADDIVIAGMGGEVITDIINTCPWLKSEKKNLILQPMSKHEFLVKNLYDNGFEIIEQKTCIAANKIYTVILATYTGRVKIKENWFYYIGKLNPKNIKSDNLFINHQIKLLNKKSLGNKEYSLIANKLAELL